MLGAPAVVGMFSISLLKVLDAILAEVEPAEPLFGVCMTAVCMSDAQRGCNALHARRLSYRTHAHDSIDSVTMRTYRGCWANVSLHLLAPVVPGCRPAVSDSRCLQHELHL